MPSIVLNRKFTDEKVYFYRVRIVLLFLISFAFSSPSFAQNWKLNKQWEFLGPDEMPSSDRDRSDVGIGPVEFIRINEQQEGLYLAGSLNGGLFYSDNAGEQWYNAGSDEWLYSGCGWADFHPTDTKTWFAYSNESDDNGKPGKIGKDGGVMRTQDGGTTWTRIGDERVFGNRYNHIYGFRFHPDNPAKMFVISADGLYYTEDCQANFVKFERLMAIQGKVYDLDFQGNKMFVTNFDKGKWQLIAYDKDKLGRFMKIDCVSRLPGAKRSITIEPVNNNLLVLVDYKTGSDHLLEYDIAKDTLIELLTNQKVQYGSGHTFKLNPHNQQELMIGYGISIRKFSYPQLKKIKMNSKHHVDIEFVAFDPKDSNRVYLATHGGLYISNDKGASWEFKSTGLGVAEVLGMDVSKTDPNEIVIGCFHDGSSVRANWEGKGYYWRIVNGGDALTALINPADAAEIYTSNQYTGGGIFHSSDTAKNIVNIHLLNKMKTSGWEMAAVLHPEKHKTLFFNFNRNKGDGKGNIDVARTIKAEEKGSAEVISNFKQSHGLKKYKVYRLYNSEFYPNQLFAYVLHYDKDSESRNITRHRLFRTYDATMDDTAVVNSWIEMELPMSRWMGDVELDPLNDHIVYLSYLSGKSAPETMFGDKGMIYTLKYKTGRGTMRREIDITRNVPNTLAGQNNVIVLPIDKRKIIFASRNGVWLASTKVTRGRGRWHKIGKGLPHCRVYKLNYNEKENMLTIGYKGRGVWRYYLDDD